MIGRTIGCYHIVARLGEGGMGSVWKAEDTVRHRPAALKFLPPGLVSAPDARRRFLHEAMATSALDHPNVAKLYETGEADGEPYFAIEFVEGETVGAILARGPLPVGEAIRIAIEAGEGLAHAHARGVVHRDVTSRNVMRETGGRVRVIDFGLAYREGTSHITSSDTTLGTLHYMAPEVLRGERTDERSDLYGLGVVLYEMLTGTVPYGGDQPAAVIYRACLGDTAAPGTLRSGISAALDAVVLRALARDPQDRFASVAEFIAALRDVAPAGLVAQGDVVDRAAAPSPSRRIVVRLPAERRVAFAPFLEVSADAPERPIDQASARGLADHLAALLAREHGLQVIPPAALQAGAPGLDALTAARREGANLLVEGIVRRAGTAVRLSFSLLDPVEGALLGGDSVEGPTAEWFALEDRLLERIARALDVRAVARRAGRLERPAAHAEYLRAVGHLQRADDEASVDTALTILEGLRRNDGASAEVEAQFARACLQKFILTRSTEWVHRAEAACREALRLDPHSAGVLVALARVQVRTGKSKEAVEVLEQALQLREQNAEAYQLLSTAWEQLSDFPRAEAACRRAIELRPGYWGVLNRYAILLYHQGKHAQAIEQWDRVIELTPDNAHGIHNRASAKFALGELQEAAEGYRRSLRVKPSASAWTGLGAVLFFSGEHAAALAAYREAVRLRPRDPVMWGNLADAQRWTPGSEDESGTNFDRAIELVREHLELNPDDAEGWSRLALWLSKRAAHADALRALDRATELGPELAAVRTAAVTVCLLAGDRVRARQLFEAAWHSGGDRTELERDPELADLRKEVAIDPTGV